MVTKQMVLDAPYHQVWHYTGKQDCTCLVGPRGAIHLNFVACRTNGATKVWKTRPTEFRLPIKYGMYEHNYLSDSNAQLFHREQDCPALLKAQELRQQHA